MGCEGNECCSTDAGGSSKIVSIYDDGFRVKVRGVYRR